MDITFPRNAFARFAAVMTATATMTGNNLRFAIRRDPAQRTHDKALRLAERAKTPTASSYLDARVGPIGPYLGAASR
jgi:hypothetical protein